MPSLQTERQARRGRRFCYTGSGRDGRQRWVEFTLAERIAFIRDCSHIMIHLYSVLVLLVLSTWYVQVLFAVLDSSSTVPGTEYFLSVPFMYEVPVWVLGTRYHIGVCTY